jgi:Putative Actinobacterial Holin-X, holin superfamily III
MSQTGQVSSGGGAAAREQSAGELVKQLTEQVSALVRDEMKLARVEMTGKGRQAALGAGLLGGGGLVALFGAGCLVACAVIGLSHVVQPWLAAMIVGVALLAVAGAAALIGKGRIQQATPPVPAEAIGSVKSDVEEIRERARR